MTSASIVHAVRANVGAKFAFDEAAYLSARGFDVTTLIPAKQPGHMMQRYVEGGLQTIDLDANFHPYSPLLTRRNGILLRRALADLKPDLVHVHHILTCFLLRMATGRHPRFKRIFEVHGPLHLEALLTRALDLGTRAPCDHYIATSRATYDLCLRHGIPRERVTMIYSGSRPEEYTQPPTGRLRSLLGIGPEVPLVGMVALMYPPNPLLGQARGLKGHDVFIRSIPLIRQRVPKARFVIIGGQLMGGGKYALKLKNLASKEGLDGVLTFLGTRSDANELQPDLDAAVHPSRSENPGGAVYTLLAAVPTAGSLVGGIPEIVRHGETGFLFPPNDVKGLANAVLNLLESAEEAKEMALRGRSLARKLFDIKITGSQVSDFYEQVLR